MNELTYRIRLARRHANFSQMALADAVGVKRSAVAQWERPSGCSPTTENLGKVAVATGAQFEWLATGRGRMSMKVLDESDDCAQVLVLRYYAHDEVEERVLMALRKLEYWQSTAVAQLAETLASGKLALEGLEAGPERGKARRA